MTRIAASLTAVLLASTSMMGAAQAQDFSPGAHFVAMWDQDGDGSVTLEEAVAHRSDIFAAFDADEDGQLSAEERAALDEMRDAEQAAMQEERAEAGMGQGMGMGMGKGQGQGQGMGMGQGMGQGQGKGQGHGPGKGPMGMGWDDAPMMSGLDANGDGLIAQDEFLSGTEAWFARMDRDGDGVITMADFGRG